LQTLSFARRARSAATFEDWAIRSRAPTCLRGPESGPLHCRLPQLEDTYV
jgi:hypothetical protein